MRRIVTLIAAVVLLIPALPAAAGKPVVTDYAEFTWGDGNYIRYDDGVVEVSFTETSYVECAGATLMQTVSLSGTTTGTLEMKNHLRDGALILGMASLTRQVVGGCDVAGTATPDGASVVKFEFVESSALRGGETDVRVVARDGIADLLWLSGEVRATGEVRRTLGR